MNHPAPVADVPLGTCPVCGGGPLPLVTAGLRLQPMCRACRADHREAEVKASTALAFGARFALVAPDGEVSFLANVPETLPDGTAVVPLASADGIDQLARTVGARERAARAPALRQAVARELEGLSRETLEQRIVDLTQQLDQAEADLEHGLATAAREIESKLGGSPQQEAYR